VKPTKIYTNTIAAGESWPLIVAGDFFKLLQVTAAVNVRGDTVDLEGITAGQGMEHTPFTRLMITNPGGASCFVKIVIGDENFLDASLGGSVSIGTNVMPSGSHVPTAPAVTGASSQALAANANRRYLFMQNQHGSGNVWVRADGGVATQTAAAVKIGPGGFWEPAQVPTGQINIIGDVAHNLLHVTEG
jgi:hypothetical protein